MSFCFGDGEGGQERADALFEESLQAGDFAEPASVEENAGVFAEARGPELVSVRAGEAGALGRERVPPIVAARGAVCDGGQRLWGEREFGGAHGSGLSIVLKDFCALAAADDFRDAEAEVAVDYYHFAASDAAAGDEEVGGFVHQLIELDDGTGEQAEYFAEEHFFFAEADGGFEFDVEE
jgi:hypothetical protein